MEIKTLNFIAKPANIEVLKDRLKDKKFIEIERVGIIKTIQLDKDSWKKFINNFFEDQDFLKDTCFVVDNEDIFTAVRITDGSTSIVVNTQGYDYAKYVAFE